MLASGENVFEKRHERTDWEDVGKPGPWAWGGGHCKTVQAPESPAVPQKAQHRVVEGLQSPLRCVPRRRARGHRCSRQLCSGQPGPPSWTAGDKPCGVHAGDSGSDLNGNTAQTLPTTRAPQTRQMQKATCVTPCDAVRNRQTPRQTIDGGSPAWGFEGDKDNAGSGGGQGTQFPFQVPKKCPKIGW